MDDCSPSIRRARRGLPLFRLGLLMVAGSVLTSIFTWYTAMAAEAGDFSRELDTERRALLDRFASDFLFAGTIPSALFWAGCLVMIAGGLVNMLRRPAPRA
ncbi:MAG: hypothetical protein IT437_10000 [Phycisphaerales bacterium]|nr:hypothetical protein [Phycisphaerales bacterium]